MPDRWSVKDCRRLHSASNLPSTLSVDCRQARLGVFFYSLALHALVLFTLLRWGHASHGHANVGQSELQLLCERARLVSWITACLECMLFL